MNWKQFLTEEVLKECWHEFVVAFPPVEPEQIPVRGHKCKHCGKYWPTKIRDGHGSRTFDNRNDLMDLYEQIEKDGKLISFLNYLNTACDWKDFDPIRDRALEYLFKWLFRLDGSGYEEKCKMVAEFYGWKEAVTIHS